MLPAKCTSTLNKVWYSDEVIFHLQDYLKLAHSNPYVTVSGKQQVSLLKKVLFSGLCKEGG